MDSDLEAILSLVKGDAGMTARIQEHVADGRSPSQAADLAMRGVLAKAGETRQAQAGNKMSKALDVLHDRSSSIEKGAPETDALRLVNAQRAPKVFKVGSVTYRAVDPCEASGAEDPRRFGRSPLE